MYNSTKWTFLARKFVLLRNVKEMAGVHFVHTRCHGARQRHTHQQGIEI